MTAGSSALLAVSHLPGPQCLQIITRSQKVFFAQRLPAGIAVIGLQGHLAGLQTDGFILRCTAPPCRQHCMAKG